MSNQTRRSEVLDLIRRMMNHNNATIKNWGLRLHTAFWRDRQLGLFSNSADPPENLDHHNLDDSDKGPFDVGGGG